MDSPRTDDEKPSSSTGKFKRATRKDVKRPAGKKSSGSASTMPRDSESDYYKKRQPKRKSVGRSRNSENSNSRSVRPTYRSQSASAKNAGERNATSEVSKKKERKQSQHRTWKQSIADSGSSTSTENEVRPVRRRATRKPPTIKSGSEASLESEAQPTNPRNFVWNSERLAQQHVLPSTATSLSNFVLTPPSKHTKRKRAGMERLSSIDSMDLGSLEDRIVEQKVQYAVSFVYMTKPPDSGYGWVVVVISFLCQLVANGIIFTIGITLPYIAEELGLRQNEVVWIASVQAGCYLLSGPLSLALINHYGFRPMALLGTVASMVTMLLATYMNNVLLVIFFYSIIGGLAMGMICISSQLILGYYFEIFRPIATSFAYSGAGIGILMFSLMNSRMAPYIGWCSTTRVDICFLVIVLLVAVGIVESRPVRIGLLNEANTESDYASSDEYEGSYHFSHNTTTKSLKSDRKSNINLANKAKVDYEEGKKRLKSRLQSCFQNIPPPEALEKRFFIQPDPLEKLDLFYTGPADYEIKDLHDLAAELRIVIDHETAERRASINYTLLMYSMYSIDQNDTHKYCFCGDLKFRHALSLLFNFRLLRLWEFQILFLSSFLFAMGFNIPLVYSKARTEISPFYATLLLPTIGISIFLFYIISATVGYLYRESVPCICGTAVIIGGITVFLGLLDNASVVLNLVLHAYFYGIAPAFYFALRSTVFVRALGFSQLFSAFGLTSLAMGLGVFVGTTGAGYLNVYTGSYDYSFMMASICIILSGTLIVILQIFLEQRRKNAAARKVRFEV